MGSPEREDGDGDRNLLGFLFGNVDEDNQVEADYLDHVSAPNDN